MSRPFGTAAELERRRRQAVDAVRRGESPETVARVIGVNRASMYRWLAAARQPDGLAAKLQTGPAPRLSSDQLRDLDVLLQLGAQAHGWPNRLWTCARVAELIRARFGVSLHHDHVGRMLRARLHWTPQKPCRKARERDPFAIDWWKYHRFPLVAEAARERDAHLVFLDESGYMLTPTVRRTWAPCASGPELECWDRRDRISAVSALTVSPKQGRFNLIFDLMPDNRNVHAEDIVEFLEQMRRRMPKGFTVLWDGGAVHRKAKLVDAYLWKHPEIVTERLPAYAPELNPDELVWNWTKYGRLSNLAAKNTDILRDHVIGELTHLQRRPELLGSFVKKTKLRLAG
jgi:transposase